MKLSKSIIRMLTEALNKSGHILKEEGKIFVDGDIKGFISLNPPKNPLFSLEKERCREFGLENEVFEILPNKFYFSLEDELEEK